MKKILSWFNLFSAYNILLFLLQMVFIYSFAHPFIYGAMLPIPIYLEIVLTLFIQLFLYFLLSIYQTFLLWGLQWYRLSLERWHIIIWTLTGCTIVSTNAYYFPSSIISSLFFSLFSADLMYVLMILCNGLCALLSLNALSFFFFTYWHSPAKFIMICSIVSGIGFFSYSVWLNEHASNTLVKTNRNPNIILIGIDSLNPNKIDSKNSPTIQNFLNQGIVFKETISPLARTYPAWISILTGLYPIHHGARYNLLSKDKILSTHSIAWSLQKAGYQTIFATDDRRFNPIDKEFGFQHIIAPKLGANDFLIGSFNDFPLGNFLINTYWGQWIFPYNHINRASAFSYYPQSFNQRIAHDIKNFSLNMPIFLAVHFTLPHAPYTFASSSNSNARDIFNALNQEQSYTEAVQTVDQQIAYLLQVLKQNGYFEHSIIVLLSDHGETFYSQGSRQTSIEKYQGDQNIGRFFSYIQTKTDTALNKSAGHGSDLLSPDQFHCLLAVQYFKHQQRISNHKTIRERVALIDIAPTLTGLLGISTHFDGISLWNAISNQHASLPERIFFMESGILPNQHLTFEKAATLGKELYFIQPHSFELTLRDDKIPEMDALKLYAVLYKDWLLALYPNEQTYIPVLLELQTGKWVDDLNHLFTKKAPLETLLTALNQFYEPKKWPGLEKNRY